MNNGKQDSWKQNGAGSAGNPPDTPTSVEVFLAAELHRIDHNIAWLEDIIAKSGVPEKPVNYPGQDEPAAPGEQALLNVQYHHRQIAEALTSTVAARHLDFAETLNLVRARLKMLESRHQWLAQNNHAEVLLRSNRWWDQEDELDYMLDLMRRIKIAALASGDQLNNH